MIRIRGEENLDEPIGPGEEKTVRVKPGVYTVAVEGGVSGEVSLFGQATDVIVEAGAETEVSLALESFVPDMPTAPGGVLVGDQFSLSWPAVAGAVGYQIEITTSPGGGWTPYASTTSPSRLVSGLTDGRYYFRARATNQYGSLGLAGPPTAGTGVFATPPVLAPDESCAAYPPSSIASFADATVEAAVRADLGVGVQDDLTCDLLTGVTDLVIGIPEVIASLEGVQNLTGMSLLNVNNTLNISDLSPLSELPSLTSLQIRNNSISDVTPLSGMVNLTSLNLAANSISDVGPLGGLTELTFLAINENEISDISSLAGLTKLEQSFWIGRNPISDISIVSGFTNLGAFWAFETLVTDISALGALSNLNTVHLGTNGGLSDIQPLLGNPGIGAGDNITLTGTSVDCADVDALRAKGANVNSAECPVPSQSVAIVAINHPPGGPPADLQNINGFIEVFAQIDVPLGATSLTEITLLLGGLVACNQSLAGIGVGISSYGCAVDTTLFPNGVQSLQARLTDVLGNTISSGIINMTLNN